MKQINSHNEKLVKAATSVRENAYAPYSNFYIGAAVETDTGAIFTGCNVESASYGLTICAERVAIQNAVAAGYKNFTALALVSENGVFPCGACRQVIAEFSKDLPIIIAKPGEIIKTVLLQDLLPYYFSDKDLEK